VHDPNHILEMDEVQIKENLSFETQPIRLKISRLNNLEARLSI